MSKSIKIVIWSIVGIIAIIIGYISISTVVSNMQNNRRQTVTNLKVDDSTKKSNEKNSSKGSGNANSTENNNSSDKQTTKSDVKEIVKPVNSDYQYDASASRKDTTVEPVQSDDYYTDKVAEMSNSVTNDNNASSDVRDKFTAYWREVVSAIKQYQEVQNQNGEAASPEAANLINDIYNNYLGQGNTTKVILDAYSHLDMNIDNNTLKMSTPSNDVSRFSMILVGTDNQQYMYVTGNYNVKDNKLRNVSATYLKDGAVARDKVNLSEKSVQTAN